MLTIDKSDLRVLAAITLNRAELNKYVEMSETKNVSANDVDRCFKSNDIFMCLESQT